MPKIKTNRHWFMMLLALASSSIFPMAARADDVCSKQLSIYPVAINGQQRTWIEHTIEGGNTIQDEVEIMNLCENPLTVEIYAADAFMTRDASFALQNHTRDQSSIGKWTVLTTTTVALEPHQPQRIPFEIAIPKNIDQGEYLGGIVLEYDSVNETTPTTLRVGTRIYLRTLGSHPTSLEVADYQLINAKEDLYLELNLNNLSNISIQSQAIWQIEPLFGGNIHQSITPLGTIFSDEKVSQTLLITKDLTPGLYRISGHIQYGDNQYVSIPAKQVWHQPTWAVASFLSILSICLIVFVSLKEDYIATIVRYINEEIDQENKGKPQKLSFKQVRSDQ